MITHHLQPPSGSTGAPHESLDDSGLRALEGEVGGLGDDGVGGGGMGGGPASHSQQHLLSWPDAGQWAGDEPGRLESGLLVDVPGVGIGLDGSGGCGVSDMEWGMQEGVMGGG